METINTLEHGIQGVGSSAVSEETTTPYVPLESVKSAERKDATDNSKILSIAEESTTEKQDLVDLAKTQRDVQITADDKARFLDSVIKGTRFYGYADLFGGRVRVKFRSRTLAETEAIMAYVHRKGVLGELLTKSDVSDTLLAALLVAQVEEVGDVSYKEMQTPYKYVESSVGTTEPGWIADVEMWKNKPEHLTSAIGDALIDFEAKYWKMIAASKDENFWNPG